MGMAGTDALVRRLGRARRAA